MDRDDYWDMTDWSLRVAEALDHAAEMRGNNLYYGMAKSRADSPSPASLALVEVVEKEVAGDRLLDPDDEDTVP